jgi:hypothetical protein
MSFCLIWNRQLYAKLMNSLNMKKANRTNCATEPQVSQNTHDC